MILQYRLRWVHIKILYRIRPLLFNLFIHLLKVLKQDDYLLRNQLAIKNTSMNWSNI